jgi:hypothetical protein
MFVFDDIEYTFSYGTSDTVPSVGVEIFNTTLGKAFSD